MPGVYQVADAEKQIIYIGQSATDVPTMRQHLSRAGCVAKPRVLALQYSRVPQAQEAELLAAYGPSTATSALQHRSAPGARREGVPRNCSARPL